MLKNIWRWLYRWGKWAGLAALLGLAAAAGSARVQAGAATPVVYLPFIAKAPTVDVALSRVEVIQGITQNAAYRVRVADRAAVVRTFVTLTGAVTQTVSARLTCYQAGTPVATLTTTGVVPATVNEGVLAHTLNFNLAADSLCVDTGLTHTLQLDPANSLPEFNETNNTYIADGAQTFNFRSAEPLTVVIVPVTYKTYAPPTADLAYFTWMPLKVWPVSQINYELHAPIDFTGDLTTSDGWLALLAQVTNLHNTEEPGTRTKLYYGLVDSVRADGCSGGCIVGVGWNGQPTAVGFAGWLTDRAEASPTFVHEAGHNFGRGHAPGCLADNPDGNFPAAYVVSGQATIGTYGLDVATGELKSPASYYDYMTYCEPTWTSDYTYKGIFDFRLYTSSYRRQTATAPTAALYLSGSLDAHGALTLQPVYARADTPVAAEPAAGEYRVELRDAAGRWLAARKFDLTEIADGGEARWGFNFFMPAVPGVARVQIYRGETLLAERVAQGPAPVVQWAAGLAAERQAGRVAWAAAAAPAVYRVRFSADGGQTWQVLAVDYTGADFVVPPALLAGAAQPVLEVQATDGVRTATQVLALR